MTKMRQWTVMTVVAVIIVFAGGWLLLVKPQGSKISGVKAQATSEQQANQVLLQEIAAREAQKNTLPAEQAQLQKLAVQVPTVADEPGIIRSLQSASSGAGVNLITITPGAATAVSAPAATTTTTSSTTLPSTSTSTLVQLPLALSVVGTYANVESYLQLLENMPRAMLVTGFSLCPMQTTAGSTASCTAVSVPANTVVPANSLGLTLSADVFFSPTGAAATNSTTTLPSTTAPTTTTPATTPASPAATTTPAPTASAAN
jgi:Tfp pilus assembly protein PilO